MATFKGMIKRFAKVSDTLRDIEEEVEDLIRDLREAAEECSDTEAGDRKREKIESQIDTLESLVECIQSRYEIDELCEEILGE